MEGIEPFLGGVPKKPGVVLGEWQGRRHERGVSDNQTVPWSHLHTRFHLAVCKHLQQELDPGSEKQDRAKRKMRPNSKVAQVLFCLK